MNTTFRALTVREQSALETMLSVEFQDHQKLKIQISGLALRSLDETLFELASLSSPTQSWERRMKKFGVPIQCTYIDNDGAVVYVDLFKNEHDELVELEIWKPDGSDVKTYFADATLTVKVTSV